MLSIRVIITGTRISLGILKSKFLHRPSYFIHGSKLFYHFRKESFMVMRGSCGSTLQFIFWPQDLGQDLLIMVRSQGADYILANIDAVYINNSKDNTKDAFLHGEVFDLVAIAFRCACITQKSACRNIYQVVYLNQLGKDFG